MTTTALRWSGRAAAVGASLALVTACVNDTPLGPNRPFAGTPHLQAASDPGAQFAGAPAATAGTNARVVDLGACDKLKVSGKVALHAYARGVQIYRWNGTSWTFVAPSAVLFADARGRSTIGTHYAGPTWESVSGGEVVGAVAERCTPNPDAIPWLLLHAVSTEGPGTFHRVTFIQRVNTVGGNAPTQAGSFVGEVANVPYSAEYLFYRAE